VAEEERALALAEIEKARAAVEKVEKSLQAHDSMSSSREKEVHPYAIVSLDSPFELCFELLSIVIFIYILSYLLSPE
jgi:hypothetical protein